MTRPSERIDTMRAGDEHFFARLATVDDDALSAACALPGWSRAQLVAHVARNADALCNLATWARTGVPTPMYASTHQRAADIEQSARQSPSQLRADAAASSARLVDALTGLPDEAWDATVLTARGRPIDAAEIPWMRIRETWIHAVDLDAGASFDELPAEVVDELVAEVAAFLSASPDCPSCIVIDTARGARWTLGTPGATTEVRGEPAALLAWMIGRVDPDGRPALPAWL